MSLEAGDRLYTDYGTPTTRTVTKLYDEGDGLPSGWSYSDVVHNDASKRDNWVGTRSFATDGTVTGITSFGAERDRNGGLALNSNLSQLDNAVTALTGSIDADTRATLHKSDNYYFVNGRIISAYGPSTYVGGRRWTSSPVNLTSWPSDPTSVSLTAYNTLSDADAERNGYTSGGVASCPPPSYGSAPKAGTWTSSFPTCVRPRAWSTSDETTLCPRTCGWPSGPRLEATSGRASRLRTLLWRESGRRQRRSRPRRRTCP